jgi:hypothetical protein
VETGRPAIPKASPRMLAVTCVVGRPRVVGCSRNTVKAAVASLGRRGASGLQRVAGGCVRARIRELLRGVSADAGGGESRSGSAMRSDSLIEFVKTNVAILPLLILTATTGSDELSYELNDVRAADARVR